MAQLLQAREIDRGGVKAHAQAMGRERGRPFEHLCPHPRKDDAAPKLVERDSIVGGCVFSAVEPCRTFSLRFTIGQPSVQIWFPLRVQIYWGGHESWNRKLTAGEPFSPLLPRRPHGARHARLIHLFNAITLFALRFRDRAS